MNYQIVSSLFHIDALAMIMMAVILIIGVTVLSFSSRYMKGDAHYNAFLGLLFSLIVALAGMVSANNLLLFILLWGVCNSLLIKLMVHESNWIAARASGLLTAKTFLLGFICIGIGFYILASNAHSLLINHIIHANNPSQTTPIALILIFIGAMTQSGLWPFHRWLISSLNSPTPISAIMHAGLVNGGGFLLARFSPLYIKHPTILIGLFLIGLLNAIIGTTWKLMQHDVKRMLACSTMGQMGFMFAQCGLGLFPAAIAHLCFHGFFKANLFLSAPGAAQEKRALVEHALKLSSFLISLLCSLCGAFIFSLVTHISYHQYDTNIVLVTLFFIACTQCVLAILSENTVKNIMMSFFFSLFFGLFYGLTLKIIKTLLSGDFAYTIPTMSIYYDIGLIILVAFWILFLFYPAIKNGKFAHNKLSLYIYMKALNASQPSSKTITSTRNNYSFE